ncbi:PAS domain S-box protein [candidate division CSSED10-310 bacterium]|uniref:histidine kinase n=1 Tax=candidate division CSSED10-310 bacterium TaxID=2855610 RepID=A0ABV6Z3P7_UNCC1
MVSSKTPDNDSAPDQSKKSDQSVHELEKRVSEQKRELENSQECLENTNEELLIACREMKLIKSELATIKAENQQKIRELKELNDDVYNMLTSSQLATIFLDEKLTLRKFTPHINEIFRISDSELGSPFHKLSHLLPDVNVAETVKTVQETCLSVEKEVQSTVGKWYLMRVLPYCVAEKIFTGVVLTFIDISERKKAEESMRLLATVVRDSNDAITVQNFEGKITFWNTGAERIYGWTRAEAVGMIVHDIIPKAKQQEALEFAVRVMSGNNVETFETERITKDGRILTISLTATTLKDKNGEPIAMATTERDVTERKKIEERLRTSEERYALAARGSNDGIWDWDIQTNAAYFSPRWKEMLGYADHEIQNKFEQWEKLIHPDDLERLRRAIKSHLSGEILLFEVKHRLKHKNGSYRWMLSRALCIRNNDGVPIRMAGSQTDITERKRIEEIKNEFISLISSELRHPLTSISEYLGYLRDEVIGKLSRQAKDFFTMAQNNCLRLLRVINDILDIEKIETGTLDLKREEVEVMSLIEETLADIRDGSENSSISYVILKALPGHKIIGDRIRLRQVLENLIINATKSSPPDSSIELSVTALDYDIRIAVRDYGPGIPPELHDHVFSKFSQADASQPKDENGTGLGLNIAKAIVEHHDGHIGFETELGIGTTFYVDLPFRKRDQFAIRVSGRDRRRLLICTDDHLVANFLARILDESGSSTDIISSGKQVKKRLTEYEYKAIVIDLMLPHQIGIELIRDIRESEITARMPIIVLFASTDPEGLHLRGGIFEIIDWMTKPIDNDRIIEAVKVALSKSSTKGKRILHVEDNEEVAMMIRALLRRHAYMTHATDLEEAKNQLAKESYDLILLDLGLPDGTGLDLLPLLPQGIPIVIFSSYELNPKVRKRVFATLAKTTIQTDQIMDTLKGCMADT